MATSPCGSGLRRRMARGSPGPIAMGRCGSGAMGTTGWCCYSQPIHRRPSVSRRGSEKIFRWSRGLGGGVKAIYLPVGALLAALLITAPASSGPRDDVIGTLVKCADIADKAARLDCYDQAAPQLRAAARAPEPLPPPVSAQAAEPPPAPVSQQSGSFLSSLDPFGDSPQGP